MKFDDTVVLRIRRQYSKDEAVGFLLEELKKSKFETGELKSQLAEAEDTAKVVIAENEKLLVQNEKLTTSAEETTQLKAHEIQSLRSEIKKEFKKKRETYESHRNSQMADKIRAAEKAAWKEVAFWQNVCLELNHKLKSYENGKS